MNFWGRGLNEIWGHSLHIFVKNGKNTKEVFHLKRDIDKELIKCIIKAKRDLNTLNKNFETAEGELIDYYSYQIKANKSKLDYLIKEVKKQGISIDMINQMKIQIEEREVI